MVTGFDDFSVVHDVNMVGDDIIEDSLIVGDYQDCGVVFLEVFIDTFGNYF